ncbi:hypothetical protein B0J11DRAFT_312729 [Dendryphion nanum]|uniref:Cell wall anchored protein n=1 Tax=Dendryphion nanum TaxID=256645 RepID=A0A9P9DTH5_9PLEO|nr:hypothetical protein B0J11DRAFT_312729 [Dendryphion nanum]
MAFLQLYFFVALNFVAISLQQSKNPLSDFCRRWGHQTAQIDGKLYIDGGLVAWNPLSVNPLNYTNTWLLYSDLNTSSQDTGMPLQYANLTKRSEVPSLSGGILWSDEVNKCFYLYGGEYQNNPSDFTFWAYDTILNQWNETKYTSNVKSIQRTSYGAGTQINELGLGFYYGGWMNNHTSPGWNGNPIASSNLVRYDFTTSRLQNNTGPDDLGRAEGSMVYLPASDGGLLVYFGGIEDPYKNGSYVGANMSTIHIFDVSSSKWYNQTASGSIPPSRRQFCAGATWADDHSSYNIYLYGGFGVNPYNVTGFDDAYILTIPSFTWIKSWPSNNSTTVFGHGGCSANVVRRDQMLIIGGWFPESNNCDAENGQGQHNMNLGFNGPQSSLWDKYDPRISKYFVPTPVLSVVGGGPTGGATLTKPSSFANPDLQVYFTRVPAFSPRAATRTISTGTAKPSTTGAPGKTNIGAIAGGVIGGLAVLIVILSLILFCLHRRKKAIKNGKTKEKAASPPPAPVELSATNIPQEMNSPGATKYINVQQPDPGNHPAFAGPNSMHSRSPSDHHPTLSSYGTQNYHSSSPNSAAPIVSPYSTEFPHQFGHQHSPTFPPYSDDPSTYNPQISAHGPNYPPTNGLHQQEYAYSTPISPSSPTFNPQSQPQVYYPPPAEPSQRSHPSYSDRISSPEGTHYSGDTERPLPPSTSHTPAHFYAQPVMRGGSGHSGALSPTHSGEGSHMRLLGDDVGSASGSVDSRRRPVRGKFVEVDHM